VADKNTDPLAMWQNMIGEMEKGFNSFASQAMASPEFSKAAHQVGDATAGAQKQFSEMLEKYLADMNFPSRTQMTDMAGRMNSIENQLGDIKLLLQQLQNDLASRNVNDVAPKPGRSRRAPLGTTTKAAKEVGG
jgi:SMC interacting uncharacterized protein involved in chromosome segregation